MDGGGRVAEPLAGPGSGRADARLDTAPRTASRKGWRLFSPIVLPFAALGSRRRSSVAVPLGRRLPRHLGTFLTLLFFGGVVGYGLVAGGQYELFRDSYGDPRDAVAKALGFGVEQITISGLSQLTEGEVLAAAGITGRTSLPFLAVADLRARLEAVPLVKHAEIRKLYPSEMVISLVERDAFALWQKDGELFVVSADGTVIDGMRDPRFAALPLVVGEEANTRVADYVRLLDASGALRSRIRAGMLVSGRRWALKMDNGIDVQLPEQGAVAALSRLAQLEVDGRILAKDVLAIDLRAPDRVVVRLTEEAASARIELNKKKPQRGVKGIDT